jgi:hypothetical protein
MSTKCKRCKKSNNPFSTRNPRPSTPTALNEDNIGRSVELWLALTDVLVFFLDLFFYSILMCT